MEWSWQARSIQLSSFLGRLVRAPQGCSWAFCIQPFRAGEFHSWLSFILVLPSVNLANRQDLVWRPSAQNPIIDSVSVRNTVLSLSITRLAHIRDRALHQVHTIAGVESGEVELGSKPAGARGNRRRRVGFRGT